MKTIGLLGGMSSVASAEYYRRLNEAVRARLGGHASAELILYSVNFAVIEECIRTGRWDAAATYLAQRGQQLERAGAEFILLATNTLHRVADQIQTEIGVPLIHIVDVAADAALAAAAQRVGLLGTAPVMQEPFYRERAEGHGLSVVVPGARDRAEVHRIIFEELTHGRLIESSRRSFVRIINELRADGAQAVILGCTEISLLVGPADTPEVALLDTTELHVARAVQLSLGA